MVTTDIIMVTYNRLKLTQKSLESIWNRTTSPYRLIVVDNNSTDGTREYLKQKHNNGDIDELIQFNQNIGLESALKAGMTLVVSDFFVTTDNDCIAPDLYPDWLEQLYNLMIKHPDFAAIALRPQVLIGVGNIFATEKEVVENNVVGGSYRMMRKSAVQEVGGWTEKFENGGRGKEEWDICTKLRNANWKVGYARNIWTNHQWGSKKWGYDNLEDYRMGRVLTEAPDDIPYDKRTCEPQKKYNQ